jgi:protein SCO1/2
MILVEMNRKKHTALLISNILIAIPVLAFAIITMLQNKYEKLPVYNSTLNTNKEDKTPHFIQSFSLINQHGKKFSDNELKNKIYVADFFFTSCLSSCPKMTDNLKQVQDAFKNDNNVNIISFTVDPERDTVQRLNGYANHFNINTNKWNFLTGSKKEIYKLARESFYVSAGDGDGGPDDFIHSDKLILVDKQKQIRGYYTGTEKNDVEQLIHDIKKLEDEN